MATFPPNRRRRGRFGRGVRASILLALVVLMLRTWCVQGIFTRFEIRGDSMAYTLLGLHQEITCGNCSRGFVCGAMPGLPTTRAVCPNCDTPNDPTGLPVIVGDRVLIGPSVYRIRPPRRWELVAFRHPHDPQQGLCIKRVVGLPGESVQIRHGEVYVDGQLARKPLAQQRAMAVLIHDADQTQNPPLPPRWQSEPAGAWGSVDGRFAHAWDKDCKSIDWLTYRHWWRLPGVDNDVREAPITNRDAYCQGFTPHPASLHPVGDLLLAFRVVRVFGTGCLLVRASDGQTEFEIRMTDGRYELCQDGHRVAASVGPRLDPGLCIEVSLIDRQFLLAVDGRTVVDWPYDPPDHSTDATSRPLAIGSEGLGVEIRHLRVYRDIYYTRPLGHFGRWGVDNPASMGGDEYFVLGDNSLVSSDSRIWGEGPAVRREFLLGKPFLVFRSARRIELGRWHFQVPVPEEIRYIQ